MGWEARERQKERKKGREGVGRTYGWHAFVRVMYELRTVPESENRLNLCVVIRDGKGRRRERV